MRNQMQNALLLSWIVFNASPALAVNSWVGIGNTSPSAYLDVSTTSSSLFGATGVRSAQTITTPNGGQTISDFVSNSNLDTGGCCGSFTMYGLKATPTLGHSGGSSNVYGVYSAPSIVSGGGGGGSIVGIYSNPTLSGPAYSIYSAILMGGNVGIGTTSPGYTLDIQNSTNSNQLHLSGTGNDEGGYLLGYGTNGAYLSGGVEYNGTSWIAKNATVSLLSQNAGQLDYYSGTGQTVGSASTFTSKFTIASGGNVGIGTPSPSSILDVNGYLTIRPINGEGGTIKLKGQNGTDIFVENINGDLRIINSPWNAELARFTQSGFFYAGVGEAPGMTGKTGSINTFSSNGPTFVSYVNNAGNINQLVFFNPNGEVGYINTNGATTIFGTSSDRRLKEEIGDLSKNRIMEVISKLKPRHWNWKYVDGQPIGEGFVAQELYDVLPTAVNKGDDNPDLGPKDSGFSGWGLDYSKLTPYLTGAVQILFKDLEDTKKNWASDHENLKKRIDILESENRSFRDWACSKDSDAPFCK